MAKDIKYLEGGEGEQRRAGSECENRYKNRKISINRDRDYGILK